MRISKHKVNHQLSTWMSVNPSTRFIMNFVEILFLVYENSEMFQKEYNLTNCILWLHPYQIPMTSSLCVEEWARTWCLVMDCMRWSESSNLVGQVQDQEQCLVKLYNILPPIAHMVQFRDIYILTIRYDALIFDPVWYVSVQIKLKYILPLVSGLTFDMEEKIVCRIKVM